MPGEDPLLVPTDAGPTLLWKGLYFYPQHDPIEYARRKARVFSPRPRSVLFVPSVGLGHGLAELLEQLPENCAILCAEASQEVMAIALRQGLPRDPRLVIVRTDDPAELAAALAGLGIHNFRRVMEVPLCTGYRLAPELYGRFRSRLEEEIRRYWQNRLTLIALGSLQVRNIISNLALIPHAEDFSALSTDLPVVVAGAGPSLDETIPALRELRKRFLLVAVDTALPALMAEGIIPDVVVALEAQTANLQDFLPARDDSIALACDLSSHPSINRLFTGRLFFFSSRFAELRLFDRLARTGLLPAPFPALGSVGVAAVHAGLRIGRAEVYLTGLDFSFPASRTHARGAPHHLAMLIGGSRTRPVGQDSFGSVAARALVQAPDKRGGRVATDRVLKSYRDTLQEEVKEHGDRVRDIGPLGLDLGVPRISRAGFEEGLCRVPAASSARLLIDPGRGFSAGTMRGFLLEEKALLQQAMDSARQAAATGLVSQACRALIAEVDYAWVHFPDELLMGTPGRSFLARVGVAAGYYANRMGRIESVL
jgi:hypothetical protein